LFKLILKVDEAVDEFFLLDRETPSAAGTTYQCGWTIRTDAFLLKITQNQMKSSSVTIPTPASPNQKRFLLNLPQHQNYQRKAKKEQVFLL